MTRLYMMRHGQTLFNVLRRKQGWCDSPLTEEGIAQAGRAGAWFREQGITFDHAYSSTSERACDTLEIVAPGMSYERVKGLKEWNFGTFEGLTEDADPPLPYGDFFKQFGGETEMELRERYTQTVCELMARPGQESVLIVSHGAAVAQFRRWLGENLSQTSGSSGTRVYNCGFVIYDVENAADIDSSSFTLVGVANPGVGK